MIYWKNDKRTTSFYYPGSHWFKDLEIIDQNQKVYRKADLRVFVLSGKETKVWKSGLTRFSRNPDSFIVNSSQGGGFKDTWVLSR